MPRPCTCGQGPMWCLWWCLVVVGGCFFCDKQTPEQLFKIKLSSATSTSRQGAATTFSVQGWLYQAPETTLRSRRDIATAFAAEQARKKQHLWYQSGPDRHGALALRNDTFQGKKQRKSLVSSYYLPPAPPRAFFCVLPE